MVPILRAAFLACAVFNLLAATVLYRATYGALLRRWREAACRRGIKPGSDLVYTVVEMPGGDTRLRVLQPVLVEPDSRTR